MHKLREYLSTLVAAVVLPSALFGLVTALLLAENIAQDQEENARRLAETAAAHVAGHLQTMTTAVSVLAQAPSLQEGRLDTFYRFAQKMQDGFGNTVILSDLDGNQVVNTAKPFGAPLPRRAEMESHRRAVMTRQPALSNLHHGAVSGRPRLSIDVPVIMDGAVRYVLTVATEPSALAAVLLRTRSEPGWIVGLLDGQGNVIVRSLDADRFVGSPARVELREAVRRSAAGTVRNVSLEGIELLNVFQRVEGTDWAVAIGVPVQLLQVPLRLPLALLFTAGTVVLVLTALIAARMGSHLGTAARRLTEAARALGRGEDPQPVTTVHEFEEVSRALTYVSAELRDKEARLEEAWHTAERLADEKARLLTAVSHDVRQPLVALGLFVELLESESRDAHARRLLPKIRSALGSAVGMLESLVQVSAIESGRVEPQLRPVALRSLIVEAAESHQETAEDAPVVAAGYCQRAQCQAAVVSDPVLLRRIVGNLVANAVRYARGADVRVRCVCQAGRTCVFVSDTGPGIPAEKLPHIFEEFYRGQQTRQWDGAGLGLSIVARLATLLRHKLCVRTREGAGTSFMLVIPHQEAVSAPAD